ncbi:deoxyribodipyrimidine photo-lyase [Tenuifilaceae bacterium CYCD]|nr:deoxyribodipyrimidine photo-lyase [Tenuifilaceae bacterium CYCD]
MNTFNKHRVREIKSGKKQSGPVVYWMLRDQRVEDNWSLVYAATKANEEKSPLVVIFTLTKTFPGANLRHYDFMLKGLKKVEDKLLDMGINFCLLKGDPSETVPEFINKIKASILISDFNPLKIKQEWKESVNKIIEIPHLEVDAHNIIPCWFASAKLEFGAYTLRPKIRKLLSTFLVDFPDIKLTHPKILNNKKNNWHDTLTWLNPFSHVKPVNWILPGEDEAIKMLQTFLNEKLTGYSTKRNDPNLKWQSNLSVYLHFGQISAQRIAIEAIKANAPKEDKWAFLEELIVRRELSDNFCYYNQSYARFSGFPDWAKTTHKIHRFDVREYLYTTQELEHAKTHDPLWNAAQMEMVKTGKMHGYMRMYWAKKILEWTTCPEEALRTAIYLNDKYSLDGRDPNGYAGIAWSIGGVHDRAWPERPIFGKIRYMNFEGCKRKFNVDSYIAAHIC